MVITLTLSDEDSRLLAYAAKPTNATLESLAATLVRSGLQGYRMPMLQAEAEGVLKFKQTFDAAADTDTKAIIAARLAAK